MADDKDKDPPPDVNTPTLTTDDANWPLSATGDVPGSSSKGDEGPPPVVDDFAVTISTLRDAQKELLPSANAAVTSYNTLKEATNATKGWIFQQDRPGDLGEYYFWNPASQGTQTQQVQPDKDLAAQTPKMEASLDNALLSIADAVHLAGQLAYYLNLAAQVYTKADKDSFLPTE
ncbi:hypothetical protein [Actinocatenispora rupis]|uniref:Uncharacterized protein n=1 Tax=Actinocatenispora rupis TaxID=519421 RepID=A0A8J3NGF0_9ACTN|nr:hypothetical protein [Actinocatenispora rupis]GID16357.1 hypothetical protein Aru02nite_72460 [Actinocatenispora rupis]